MLQILSIVLYALAGSASAVAQVENPFAPIALHDARFGLDRLAPDTLSESAAFDVDGGTVIRIEIVAAVANLTTHIEGPGGQILDETTIDGFGGECYAYEGADPGEPQLVPLLFTPGWHHLYTFPSLGTGMYTVHFDADPGLAEEVAVITTLITDSPVAASLFATESPILLGSASVLTAALFDGAAPVAGATVTVTVAPPTGEPFTVPLLDDGGDADDAVGDGLYSGMFTPAEVGTYSALAEITGTTGGGTAFTRTGATQVTVVAPGASLTGTLTDHGEDDNGNGLFERVIVEAEVDVATAGLYILHVFLQTAGEQTLVSYGQAELATGLQTIGAAIDAAAFLAADEDGPYTVTRVELAFVSPDEGALPSGRLLDPGYQTQAYLLAQFERPSLALTGQSSDFGTDTDTDGDFDTLTVNVEMVVVPAGTYTYSATLFDPQLQRIEFLGGEQAFPGGFDPVDLVLTFNGSTIGATCADGPYEVRGLAVYGEGGSVVANTRIETQAYSNGQFDPGVDCNGNERADNCDIADETSQDCNANEVPDECDIAGPTSEDCNTNGVPDECDIAAGTSDDCTGDGVPDECDPDCNANDVPDSCDIGTGTSADCNANGVPDECDLTSGAGTDCTGDGIPDECQQTQKLTASDAAAYERFGWGVSVSGNVALIGAPNDGNFGTTDFDGPGAAYVFVHNGMSWQPQAKLVASDAHSGDHFGQAVSISGQTALVGAYGDDHAAGPNAGAAYVFVFDGATWTQQAKLVAPDAAAYDWFGYAVTLRGDTALIGAPEKDNEDFYWYYAGAAYVFERTGTSWTHQATLTTPEDPYSDFRFGRAVSLSGDTAAIGTSDNAHVFVREGTACSPQATLIGSDTEPYYDDFRECISLSGDTVVVGAHNHGNSGGGATNGPGAAYVFVRNGAPAWTEQAKLTASDAHWSDYFGRSVSIDGDTMVIGAHGNDSPYNSGSAYVFRYVGTDWVEQTRLTAFDAAEEDLFGYRVALSGDTALVGAYRNDDAGHDSGSAYVFHVAQGGAPALISVCPALGDDDPRDPGELDRFISPKSKHVAFDSVEIVLSEIVSLSTACTTSTGGAPPQVASLTPCGPDGVHTLRFDAPLEVGEWTTVELTIVSSCGLSDEICLQLGHLPGDINLDAQANVNDANAFGQLYPDGPTELIDLNGDGQNNLNDATKFGQIFNGTSAEGRNPDGTGGWLGSGLPPRPACDCP